jgi:hypothetical protein
MEPAKSRENCHDGSQAAVTGSAAKPRSGKAQHRTTLDQAAAAGISEPYEIQPWIVLPEGDRRFETQPDGSGE